MDFGLSMVVETSGAASASTLKRSPQADAAMREVVGPIHRGAGARSSTAFISDLTVGSRCQFTDHGPLISAFNSLTTRQHWRRSCSRGPTSQGTASLVALSAVRLFHPFKPFLRPTPAVAAAGEPGSRLDRSSSPRRTMVLSLRLLRHDRFRSQPWDN